MGEARRSGFPATVFHPGHIVGPGWPIVNPQGNFNPKIFGQLAQGQEVVLPNLGMETVHHVHASDLADIVMQSLANWSNAVGESFHAVSPAAVTLRGYAEAMADWFGQPAKLAFLPLEAWEKTVPEADAKATREHISRSPNCSIDKAKRLLNYQPRYSSLQGAKEAVMWLRENNRF